MSDWMLYTALCIMWVMLMLPRGSSVDLYKVENRLQSLVDAIRDLNRTLSAKIHEDKEKERLADITKRATKPSDMAKRMGGHSE